MTPDQAAELECISRALVAAIGEAKGRIDAGMLGTDFGDLVQHARELHELMCEALLKAQPNVDERMRGVADALGNHLEELETLMAGGSPGTVQ